MIYNPGYVCVNLNHKNRNSNCSSSHYTDWSVQKMKINNLKIHGSGYIFCQSEFYSVHDVLNEDSVFDFSSGLNILNGEIDSGIWAASYLLSMYKYRRTNFILFDEPKLTVNGEWFFADDFYVHSCYMDGLYPMFGTKTPINRLVKAELNKSKLNYSADEIKDIFDLDSERFQKPIYATGNERFRAMAAVGFSSGKDVFCFPWMSKSRFESFHRNLTGLFDILEKLDKIIIAPLGM